MNAIYDIHTHNPHAQNALISVESPLDMRHPHGSYSIGIHPWHAHLPYDFSAIEDTASCDTRVMAIGETGLDTLAEAPLGEQEHLLRRHIELSERLAKPLILHIVRAWDRLLRLHRECRPTQPWIVHGFRGKPALARQLAGVGIYLSIGERFNPASLKLIPPGQLLIESDESRLTIEEIAARSNVPLRDLWPLIYPKLD